MKRDLAVVRWSYTLLEFVLAPLLRKLGAKPAALTVAGLVFSALAGLSYLVSPVLAGCLALIGGICDFSDGYWARTLGMESPQGAFLDSVLDRVGESFLLVGIWAYLNRDPRFATAGALLVFAALIGSFMVSYTRARGEGLAAPFKGGVFLREERLLVLVVGSLADPLAPGLILLLAVAVLALGATLTALYRFRGIYRRLAGPKAAVVGAERAATAKTSAPARADNPAEGV
jgi:CDP-diacylglycerol--glycerol-3-phosphate 3-phosphatidyltransferase